MPGIKKALITIVFFIFSTSLLAQVKSIGTPFIRNYTRTNYQAGSQTWNIEQGKNGMMYFANNNGLLEFDGHFWSVYPLSNSSIVRSVYPANDSVIYAGGYEEFGYYKTGEMGGAVYTSLTGLLSAENLDFGDVWKIHELPDGIVFQTYTQLMFYKDGDITTMPAPSAFHFSFLVNNEYYVNDIEHGLMRYALGKLHPLIGMEYLKGEEIWGMLSIGNDLLIATASKGCFIYDGNSLKPWNNSSNNFLKQNQIFNCFRLNESLIAFGTIQNGLLISENNGVPVQHINREDGLQNNTVLCIGLDQFNNLWLGTDHGIDYIETNSPLSQLSMNYGLGAGYAAIIFKDYLYLGTNQGLFVKSVSSVNGGGIEPKELKLIEETQGQVWNLSEINGSLFCGHNNGTFLVQGESVKKIADVPGGWTYLQIPGDSSKIIGGTYSGLTIYQKHNNQLTYIKKIDGFSESSRTLAFDNDGSLWIAHGYRGVYHLFFNDSYDSVLKVDLYDNRNSVLPTLDISLAKIENDIVFTSDQNIYSFSEPKNDFVINETFQNLFGSKGIRAVEQDKEGNFWYFNNNQTGVFRLQEDGNFNRITLPFRQLEGVLNYSFELVYPKDDQNVFFGTEKGFIHYNPSITKNYSYQFKIFLRSMKTFFPDSLYSFRHGSLENSIKLDYKNNDVEFRFAANDFENQEKISYSTFLQGYDEDWSTWQLRNSRDFTNLDEGDYIFKVKAKNIYGTVTEEVGIGFRVLPPFERSVVAYFLYGVALLILLTLFGWILKRRFKRAELRSQKEQQENFRRVEEKLQRETLEAEKQVIRMRNEKLRAEVKLKDKELANQTMQMIQDNKFLISQRKSLEQIALKIEDPERKFEIKKIIRKINKTIDSENQWEVFETHFENVHEEFLKRIKMAFPALTPVDLKLCAYLRMNISSKEIAVLMNISVRGVEISRYRLRKKLNLDRSVNLTEFIITF